MGLVKNRHTANFVDMEKTAPNIAPASGLINHRVSMAHFDLIRIGPSDALKPFVENYWIILWDLSGKPDYVQENLPHPSINLVVDPMGQSGIFGAQNHKFVYRLSGAGRIFGVKFWPGAFYNFYGAAVKELGGTHVEIEKVFGIHDAELDKKFLQVNDPIHLSASIEKMLLDQQPILDFGAREARRLVEIVSKAPAIVRVSELAKIAQLSERSLQRLFDTYVGVSPKWVIDRYRMLAAVDALNRGEQINLTDLAHQLGYFDSAHFGRAFKALTGISPSTVANLILT